VPFQYSAPSLPTPQQRLGVEQDTASIAPGEKPDRHTPPLRRKSTELLTAKQAVTHLHETLESGPASAGAATAARDHDWPFQCTRSGFATPAIELASSATPTAQHELLELQLTAESKLSLLGFGEGSTDHLSPFQCSTSGAPLDVAPSIPPTAQQDAVLVQSTADR